MVPMVVYRYDKVPKKFITGSSQRGKGYSGRLVGEVTQKIFSIGYILWGELTQFKFP